MILSNIPIPQDYYIYKTEKPTEPRKKKTIKYGMPGVFNQ
jgi:hypothetical protein